MLLNTCITFMPNRPLTILLLCVYHIT